MILTHTILSNLIGVRYVVDMKAIRMEHLIFLSRILTLCFLWICRGYWDK